MSDLKLVRSSTKKMMFRISVECLGRLVKLLTKGKMLTLNQKRPHRMILSLIVENRVLDRMLSTCTNLMSSPKEGCEEAIHFVFGLGTLLSHRSTLEIFENAGHTSELRDWWQDLDLCEIRRAEVAWNQYFDDDDTILRLKDVIREVQKKETKMMIMKKKSNDFVEEEKEAVMIETKVGIEARDGISSERRGKNSLRLRENIPLRRKSPQQSRKLSPQHKAKAMITNEEKEENSSVEEEGEENSMEREEEIIRTIPKYKTREEDAIDHIEKLLSILGDRIVEMKSKFEQELDRSKSKSMTRYQVSKLCQDFSLHLTDKKKEHYSEFYEILKSARADEEGRAIEKDIDDDDDDAGIFKKNVVQSDAFVGSVCRLGDEGQSLRRHQRLDDTFKHTRRSKIKKNSK